MELLVVIGIISVLIYNSLLAQVKPSNVIGFSKIMNALWKSMPPVKVFLFNSVLSLIVTSIPELIKKRKSKLVINSIAIGLALFVTTSIFEFQMNQKRIKYNTLDTVQVIELYEQLTGQAGKRQVKDAHIGLAQNMGGSGASCTINILEAL